METKDAYKARIDAQLKEWSAKIAELKAKANVAEAHIKAEYLKQVEALQTKKEETQTKLEELKKAGDEAWETLKVGVEHAAFELKNAIYNAASKFK